MKNIIKKTSAVAIALCIAFSTASCTNKSDKNNEKDKTTTTISASTSGSSTSSSSTSSSSTSGSPTMNTFTNAKELIDVIWSSFPENDKFAVSGGDENHMNMSGAGVFSITDAQMLDNVLGFPASKIDKINEAASLVHSMNQNTFTCAAYRFKNSNDMDAGIAAIKSNILARRWICGNPDKLLIISVPSNYVIAVWGIDEGTGNVTKFKEAAKSAVNGAQVIVEEPIV